MLNGKPRKLNATAPLMLEAYPTKIDVHSHADGVYHLNLHYLNPQDAALAAGRFKVEADDCQVHLFTAVIYGGSLTQALQKTFSCHYVEFHP